MPFTIVHSSTNKEALRTEKVRKNCAPDLQETVASIFMVESPSNPLYSLGNIQSEKSEKKLHPAKGLQLENNSLQQPPTYLRNIETGKSKKEF